MQFLGDKEVGKGQKVSEQAGKSVKQKVNSNIWPMTSKPERRHASHSPWKVTEHLFWSKFYLLFEKGTSLLWGWSVLLLIG